MKKTNATAVRGEVSVLLTLPHISARKTASVTGKNFNSQSVWLSAGLDWHHHIITPTSPTWCVPSSLFRSRSTDFLCELQAVRRRCFTLCESPSAENWRTTAPEIMRRRCVKRAIFHANFNFVTTGILSLARSQERKKTKCVYPFYTTDRCR